VSSWLVVFYYQQELQLFILVLVNHHYDHDEVHDDDIIDKYDFVDWLLTHIHSM
jgi:hypothetical protein